MEKSAKDQADGKCHRTCPLPPTVGLALARIVRANASLELSKTPLECVARDSPSGQSPAPLEHYSARLPIFGTLNNWQIEKFCIFAKI